MGNKASSRRSAPDGRHRRSLWRHKTRHFAPCRPTEWCAAVRPRDANNDCSIVHPLPSLNIHVTNIHVTNLQDSELLTYPLVLVEGVVDNIAAANLPDNALYVQAVAHEVESDSDNSWVGSVCWPVVRESGHFKAFVHLTQPGIYHIRLRIAATTHQLTVCFKPRRTKWIVRFHYQKPHDSFQGFDAPTGVDNSDSDACQRIQFSAMVLQTVVAELFHRAGLSRKTFAMELDADGFPVVEMVRSPFSVAQGRRMTDSRLLAHLKRDLQAVEPTTCYRVKHVVLLGGTRFNPLTQALDDVKTVVGGGVVATSVCNLFTWPRHLTELTGCCFNTDVVAPELSIPQCSVRRGYWSNYSGGLSVLLHLLGLSFRLKYQADGVMHKSFRGVTRILVAMEPQSGMQQSSALGRAIGDGRFYKLDYRALKPVGTADEDTFFDDQSIGDLVFGCRWIHPKPAKKMHISKAMPAIAA